MSVVRRRPGSPPASVPIRRGSVQVSEVQRSRMLSSAVQVVSEYGYGQMSVARVTGRARVSRRTFYDVFEDREDCFLAIFDEAVARVSESVVPAYEQERAWREKVRAALAVLLEFLDEQPEVGPLLVVDALRAGPRVLQRRAEILEGLGTALDQGGLKGKAPRGLPDLTGEGVVGAVFSVIHTRLSAERPGSLVGLLNPLMAMIALPYQGSAAAQRELERPVQEIARVPRAHGRSSGVTVSSPSSLYPVKDPLADLPMRLTYRTLRVLSAIGERSGASNREIADTAGVHDQGQMSKLLARLERLELIHNTTAGQGRHQPTGEPNAWCLTARGEEVERVTRVPVDHTLSYTGGARPSTQEDKAR